MEGQYEVPDLYGSSGCQQLEDLSWLKYSWSMGALCTTRLQIEHG